MTPTLKLTCIIIGVFLLAGSAVNCASENTRVQQEEFAMPEKTIEEVLSGHTEELMSVPGVIGTAQGLCDNKPCIKVYVIEQTPELERKIPPSLEGYPVMVEETGEIRALPEEQP